MSSTTLEFHEAANIFPMDDEHFDDLGNDIKTNGQQIPIELMDGKILDGRRRYMACKKVGVEPKFKQVKVDDPVAYVLSLNLHRRHLTPSQLSMCAARAKGIYDQAAKERQKTSTGGSSPQLVANLPEADKGRSRDQAAKAFGIGGRTVDYATKVINKAVPEVVKAVDQGRMAVSTAAVLASEPPEVQRQEATNPKRNRAYKPNSGGGKQSSESVRHEPPKHQPRHDGEHTESEVFAIEKAKVAVTQLKGIPSTNKYRDAAFQYVTKWIETQGK